MEEEMNPIEKERKKMIKEKKRGGGKVWVGGQSGGLEEGGGK